MICSLLEAKLENTPEVTKVVRSEIEKFITSTEKNLSALSDAIKQKLEPFVGPIGVSLANSKVGYVDVEIHMDLNGDGKQGHGDYYFSSGRHYTANQAAPTKTLSK